MTPLEAFFLITTLVSLFWGYRSYIAAKPQLHKLKKRKAIPKLEKELALIEKLHDSPSERVIYLLQALLFCAGAAGAILMFSSIEHIFYNAGFSSAIRWFGGAFIYLFAAYRMGRCAAATTYYKRNIDRLKKAINDAEDVD